MSRSDFLAFEISKNATSIFVGQEIIARGLNMVSDENRDVKDRRGVYAVRAASESGAENGASTLSPVFGHARLRSGERG